MREKSLQIFSVKKSIYKSNFPYKFRSIYTKYKNLRGIILKKIGKARTASQKFTDCLEIGTVYDPDIRRKCLEQLKEILEVCF